MTQRDQALADEHANHGWYPVDLADSIERVRFECGCGWSGWVHATLAGETWLTMARMRYRIVHAKMRIEFDEKFK